MSWFTSLFTTVEADVIKIVTAIKTEEQILAIDVNLALKWIANKGFSSAYGAREILRVVQDEIKSFFVDEVLFGKLSNGGKARIGINNDNIDISIED